MVVKAWLRKSFLVKEDLWLALRWERWFVLWKVLWYVLEEMVESAGKYGWSFLCFWVSIEDFENDDLALWLSGGFKNVWLGDCCADWGKFKLCDALCDGELGDNRVCDANILEFWCCKFWISCIDFLRIWISEVICCMSLINEGMAVLIRKLLIGKVINEVWMQMLIFGIGTGNSVTGLICGWSCLGYTRKGGNFL